MLLDAFDGIAIERDWYASSTEITSDTELARVIATMTREALLDLSRTERMKERGRRALGVLKAFAITTGVVDLRIELDAEEGRADSGDLGRDLGDLLIEVGQVAKVAGRGVVFLLDEVQLLERSDFEALIAGMHRASRRQLPITVVGAGLPMLPRLAGEAKSYAERLFVFPNIGALTVEEARMAFVDPAADEGVEWTDEALERALDYSGRYPYFIQQYGKHSWLTAKDNVIDRPAVERAHELVLTVLDTDFFYVRFERATEVERRYLAAMATLGDGPQKSGEVSRMLGHKSTTASGPVRDALIKKGLIYSPRYGEVDFTVPLFADFMRRRHPLDELESNSS